MVPKGAHSGRCSTIEIRTVLQIGETLPGLGLAVAVMLLAGPQQLDAPKLKRALTNIQFCLDVSGSMTSQFGEGDRYDAAMKRVLRDAARPYLPEAVRAGPKRGFSVPMAEWLLGPLAEEMGRAVEGAAPDSGLLDRAALREAWEDAGWNEREAESVGLYLGLAPEDAGDSPLEPLADALPCPVTVRYADPSGRAVRDVHKDAL